MADAIVTGARLVDGDTELVLLPSDGVRAFELDLGYPTPRVAVFDRAGRDGVDDETTFHGGRQVLVALRLLDLGGKTPAQWRDELMTFMRPGRRTRLVYTLDGLGELQITLRADQVANVLGRPTSVWEVRAGWFAPDGRVESTTLKTWIANPQGIEAGRTYPRAYPRSYPAFSGRGKVLVNHDGTTDADLTVRIHGPCPNPRIANETVGRAIEFDGLTIAAGDYVELDMAARTARLNGLADSNVYGLIDFPASQWWTLAPGQNSIRFYPESSSSPCQAEGFFRDTYL